MAILLRGGPRILLAAMLKSACCLSTTVAWWDPDKAQHINKKTCRLPTCFPNCPFNAKRQTEKLEF